MRMILVVAAVLLLGASASPVLSLSHQTTSVGDITTYVHVRQIKSYVGIRFMFTTPRNSTYPVGCLNAYKDVKYTLTDKSGRVIPPDAKTLEYPPNDLLFLGYMGRPYDCKTVGHKWAVYAKLGALYPNLPPGAYRLSMTVAPRGLAETIVLHPIELRIP